jgi:hypothetical protein
MDLLREFIGSASVNITFFYCCVISVFTEALPISSLSKSVTIYWMLSEFYVVSYVDSLLAVMGSPLCWQPV